jgi:hypothetical protein
MAALDQLRDKWEAITPRERRMVVLLGVSTVIILIIYVALQIRDGLTRLDAKNARARRALVTLAATRAHAHAVDPDDPVKQIGADPIKLETYVFEAGKQANINLTEINKRSPMPRGKYVAHSVRIQQRGLTLAQVKDFLEAVETRSRIVVVSSLNLRRSYTDKEKVDLDCEIVTWARAEDAGAGSGSGAKKGG